MKILRYLKIKFFFKIIKFLVRILPLLKLQSYTVKVLNEQRSKSNNTNREIHKIISNIKLNRKLNALDIGAFGGFNIDNSFESKYNKYFEPILVEPNAEEARKLLKNYKFVIDKGLWSKECNKKLYFSKSVGGTSMYQPDKKAFKLYYNDADYIKSYDTIKTIDVECTTISKSLNQLSIDSLDYLKIDVEGGELEVLKGIGNYCPLLMKIEMLTFNLYERMPHWGETLNFINNLGYMSCSWENFGSHVTRSPIALDMIFIPNYLEEKGKNLIMSKQNEFILLMLIFGQVSLLQLISSELDFKLNNSIKKIKDKFFY